MLQSALGTNTVIEFQRVRIIKFLILQFIQRLCFSPLFFLTVSTFFFQTLTFFFFTDSTLFFQTLTFFFLADSTLFF